MIAVIVAGFFAYAGLIPMLFLLVGPELVKLQQQQNPDLLIPQPVSQAHPQPLSLHAQILIGLTMLGCLFLLIPGRRKWVYHYSRVVLALWVITAIAGLFGPVGVPMTADLSTPGRHTPGMVLLLASTALVSALFYFFSFGRTCRLYYGLPVTRDHSLTASSAGTP